MIRTTGMWLAALVMAVAAPALSQAPTPAPVPATVGTSQQIDFTSAVNGKTYRITIAKPYAFPPKGGYPVVYVLDGGAYFGTFAGAARLRSSLGAELAPAIIVGISYPSESMLVAQDRRMLDLTHNAPEASRPALGVASKPVETGGADAFYKVIETEIRPRVAAVAQVAQGKDVLFGHSLGGLFFLQDFVGESMLRFSEEKRRLFELLHHRDRLRRNLPDAGLVWRNEDRSLFSPFCGIRSGDILETMAATLDPVSVRTCAALVNLILHTRPADWDGSPLPESLAQQVERRLRARFPVLRRRTTPSPFPQAYLEELLLLDELVCDAGLLKPNNAFGVYRKRDAGAGAT